MENASKALLMAGGILIAIIIIALLARTFNNLSIFQKTKLTEEEQEQLIAFNEQYTKYVGQYVYGTDVLTIMNKYDDNKLVEVIIDGEEPNRNENYYQIKYDEDGRKHYSNETRYYKCTGVTYDNNGRVNSISFTQIKLDASGDL